MTYALETFSFILLVLNSRIIGEILLDWCGIIDKEYENRSSLYSAIGLVSYLCLTIIILRFLGLMKLDIAVHSAFIFLNVMFSTLLLSVKSKCYRFKITNLRLYFTNFHLLVFVIFLSTLFLPIYENDVLEYIGVSRAINLHSWNLNYPPIHSSMENPLFANSTHPLVFHLLINLLFPEQVGSLFLRIFSSFIVFWSCNLFTKNRLVILILYLSTPIFMSSYMGLHIDNLRVLTIFIALRLIWLYLNDQGNYNALWLALLLPSAVHSSGLLISFVFLLSFFSLRIKILSITLQNFKKFMLVALIFSSQYLVNIAQFGFIVSDNTIVLNENKLSYAYYLDLSRNNLGFIDSFINSFLSLFFNIGLFGSSCAIFLLTIGKISKVNEVGIRWIRFLFLSIAYFSAFFLISIAFGENILSKSPRYPMMILPFSILYVSATTFKSKNEV